MSFAITMVWYIFFTAAAGFLFQSLLPSPYRIIIYPISLVIGILLAIDLNYYLISFNMGMIGRAAAGRYWHCVVMEAGALLFGFLAGTWALA